MTPAKKSPAKKASTGKKRGPKKMTAQHKAALAAGRTESAAVRGYLDALASSKPKRGRKRTPDSINKRLAAIQKELASANSLKALSLKQEELNLRNELKNLGTTIDLSGLEKAFVKAAKTYGERKGITYGAWRSVGVPAEVLAKAGIARTRG
jgi:hypothetical protein